MHYLDDTLVFSPSDLIIFMASPFASWMERLTLEHPDHGIESDGRAPLLQTLANRGMQHERAYLDQLTAQGLDMVVIDAPDPQAAESATRDAMQAGAQGQALLRHPALLLCRPPATPTRPVSQNRDLPEWLNLIPD